MPLPTPYFQTPDGAITLYHGDCRDILPQIEPGTVDLVLTDPPYGISLPTDYKARGRGGIATCIDYPPVEGDTEPFDPGPILALNVPTILWGGNWFSSRLPDMGGWLVWDKKRPDGVDQAEAELAWTNVVKGVRVFRHLWHGCMRASERGEHWHPTQKPVALYEWALSTKWTRDLGVILDPYAGAGPCLLAARNLGRRAIGIEIEERYCEIAAGRLGAMSPAHDDEPLLAAMQEVPA
jgi:site-specific DNA-methyltransferase (adenine-specific)